MNRTLALTIATALTVACRTDSTPGMDSGSGATEPSVGGGCELVEEVPLELDGTAPDGRDIQNWVSYLVVSHSASLLWADGERTGLVVNLTDPTNVRWRDYEVSGDGGMATIEIACDDSLAVDVNAAFITEDGRLNESVDVVLYTNHGIGDGAFTADLTTTDGTLEISDFATESFDTLTASLDATWNENGIMGGIDGFGETTDGSAVSMSRFDIASFGATGF